MQKDKVYPLVLPCVAVLTWTVSLQPIHAIDWDPGLIGHWPKSLGGPASARALGGDCACVVVGGGLQVIDIPKASNPTTAGEYRTDGSVSDVAISGSDAAVLAWLYEPVCQSPSTSEF